MGAHLISPRPSLVLVLLPLPWLGKEEEDGPDAKRSGVCYCVAGAPLGEGGGDIWSASSSIGFRVGSVSIKRKWNKECKDIASCSLNDELVKQSRRTVSFPWSPLTNLALLLLCRHVFFLLFCSGFWEVSSIEALYSGVYSGLEWTECWHGSGEEIYSQVSDCKVKISAPRLACSSSFSPSESLPSCWYLWFLDFT